MYVKVDSTNIIEMYSKGISINKISDQTGYSVYAVNKVIKSIKEADCKDIDTRGIMDILKDNIDQIESLFDAGMTKPNIAKQFNCSISQITNFLYYIGKTNIYSEEIEEDIIQLYKSGMRIVDIYRKLDITNTIVERVVAKYKYINNFDSNSSIVSDELIAKVVGMYNDRKTVYSIARELNLSYKFARDIVKDRCTEVKKVYDREDKINTIKEYRLLGYSYSKIAKTLEINVPSVFNTVAELIDSDKLDIDIRSKLYIGNKKCPKCDEIINMLNGYFNGSACDLDNTKCTGRKELVSCVRIAYRLNLIEADKIIKLKEELNIK